MPDQCQPGVTTSSPSPWGGSKRAKKSSRASGVTARALASLRRFRSSRSQLRPVHGEVQQPPSGAGRLHELLQLVPVSPRPQPVVPDHVAAFRHQLYQPLAQLDQDGGLLVEVRVLRVIHAVPAVALEHHLIHRQAHRSGRLKATGGVRRLPRSRQPDEHEHDRNTLEPHSPLPRLSLSQNSAARRASQK